MGSVVIAVVYRTIRAVVAALDSNLVTIACIQFAHALAASSCLVIKGITSFYKIINIIHF